MILAKMMETVEAYLGVKVNDAVFARLFFSLVAASGNQGCRCNLWIECACIIIEPTGTVETLSTSTGAFQDRENAFSSVGYFSGKTFINYSNDDKLTDEHHVMTKIRTVEPLTGHFEVGRSWFALPRFRTVCPRRPVFPWPAPDQQGRC